MRTYVQAEVIRSATGNLTVEVQLFDNRPGTGEVAGGDEYREPVRVTPGATGGPCTCQRRDHERECQGPMASAIREAFERIRARVAAMHGIELVEDDCPWIGEVRYRGNLRPVES